METSGHLDPLQLDALRTGDASAEARRHVAECAACRAGLAELESMAAALRPLARAPFAIPDETDRRILWLARKQAAVVRKAAPSPRRRAMIGGAWAAAAAVVLAVGAMTWRQLDHAAPPAATVARRSTDDVDGDGRVDILDAFALARALQDRGATARQSDANGDGVVDQHDVDAIARAAVKMGKV